MTQNNCFKLGEISEEFNEITDEIVNIFDTSDIDYDSFALSINKIVDDLVKKNELLSIAFIGQYSAGKSTIISALTGDDTIKIDADIATDKVTKYIWNGNLLVDTPGLYTDNNDHDDITYQAIKESDLLVFVITSDLFDSITLDNFIKLAFEKGYKNKMILVVNKMSMEAGSFNKLKQNYLKELRKSLKPYRLSDFNTSFIDAYDYIDGRSTDIKDFIEMSNFKAFINQLNKFVDKKGLLGSLESPVRLVISEVDKAIISTQSNNTDKSFFLLLDRIEDRIKRSMTKVKNEGKFITSDLKSLIVSEGHKISTQLGTNTSLDDELKRAEANIEKYSIQKSEELENFLEEEKVDLSNEINDIYESDVGQFFFNELSTKTLNVDNEKSERNVAKVEDVVEKLNKVVSPITNVILQSSGDITKITSKTISNSNLHQGVYKVGKFFGVKFKPWGAVNLSAKLAKFAKVLGPIMIAISTILDLADTVESSKAERKMIQARNDCIAEFSSIASDMKDQFDKELEDYIKNYYLESLKKISNLRKDKLDNNRNISTLNQNLKQKREDLYHLITKIY